MITTNNLLTCKKSGRVCKLFGIRLVTVPAVVQLAVAAGFDALFIELEHSVLTERDANILSTTALLAGITPFVRVPLDCGDGFVQRILDAGAMGVIFPHVDSAVAARRAVAISKYPPAGHRSMTAQLPQFGMVPTPAGRVIPEMNEAGSTVIVMIESRSAVENVEEIAAVVGVDVLLVGTNDLAIEMGQPGDFESKSFKASLQRISNACKKSDKILGIAGIYQNEALLRWAMHELGTGFLLCQLDSGLLSQGIETCLRAIEEMERN